LQRNDFYYHLVLIAQHKISVLATWVTSSNLRNKAPLFTERRLLQGTHIRHRSIVTVVCA